MKDSGRQVLLDILDQYRELEFPANPDLLKVFIDNATDRLDAIYQVSEHNSKEQEATTDSASLPKMDSGGDTSLREQQLEAILKMPLLGCDIQDWADAIDRYGQEIAREAHDERVRKYGSFCGCPMCTFHTEVSDMLATGYKPPQQPSNAPNTAPNNLTKE